MPARALPPLPQKHTQPWQPRHRRAHLPSSVTPSLRAMALFASVGIRLCYNCSNHGSSVLTEHLNIFFLKFVAGVYVDKRLPSRFAVLTGCRGEKADFRQDPHPSNPSTRLNSRGQSKTSTCVLTPHTQDKKQTNMRIRYDFSAPHLDGVGHGVDAIGELLARILPEDHLFVQRQQYTAAVVSIRAHGQ